ncbi:MAG TPA: HAD family phosphatase [Candidatus Coatesbacteria bacterium]|nr:HAD family phosphatase [Candidatus Coatesbacteria bacterium]
MIEAVIFDLDGVLVDSEPLQFEAYATVLAGYGHALSREDFIENWLGQGRLAEHLKRYEIEVPVEEVRRAKNDIYARLIRERMKLRPGVEGLVRRLHREMPVALASSAHPDSVNAVLDRFELRPYFTVVLTSADVKRNKPDPEIYLAASERLGVPPKSCLVFEDSRPGVLAAKAAGMMVIALPHDLTLHQDLSAADLVICDLRNLRLRLGRRREPREEEE